MSKLINGILMIITALFIAGCESGFGFIGGGDPMEGEWRFESEEGVIASFSDGQMIAMYEDLSYEQIGEELYEFRVDGETEQVEVIIDGDRMIWREDSGHEEIFYRLD